MTSQTRSASAKVKKAISDMLNEDTNINIICSDVLVKLLDSKEDFYSNFIEEFKTSNDKILENINKGFAKVTQAISNINTNYVNNNGVLLQKMDALCNTIKSTNTLVSTESRNENSDQTNVFKNELNERKITFYKGFRSQQLSEYYNTLISGEQKFVPDKFRPRVNKNTPEFELKLKKDDAIENMVREIKLLHARSKDFQSKLKDIDEKVINKIYNLGHDNDVKLTIKNLYQENCQNEENKSKAIWNKNFEKLRNTYENEMRKNEDHFLKFVSGEQEQDNSDNHGQYQNSKNEYRYNPKGRYRQYNRTDHYNNRQQK